MTMCVRRLLIVTREGLAGLKELFSTARAVGSQMAAQAAGPLAVADEIAASCATLTKDVLEAVSAELR